MLTRKAILTSMLIVLCGSLAYGEIVANLQPTGEDNFYRDPCTYTIDEIDDAGGLIVGDKFFDSWHVTTTKTVDANAPAGDTIGITPILVNGDYGVIFNGPWAAPAGGFADSTIEFHVSIIEPQLSQGFVIKDAALWLTAYGVSNNTAAGFVSVSENIYYEHPSQGGESFQNMLVYYRDNVDKDVRDGGDFTDANTQEPIRVTEMWVIKDVVAYGGSGDVGIAHVSEFYQTYSQVPEPATMLLLALGSLAVVVRRRRR